MKIDQEIRKYLFSDGIEVAFEALNDVVILYFKKTYEEQIPINIVNFLELIRNYLDKNNIENIISLENNETEMHISGNHVTIVNHLFNLGFICRFSENKRNSDDNKEFSIGLCDFRNYIEGKFLYVDKTFLIREIIDNKEPIQLIIRPRRFGKSMNLSMLKYFFSMHETDEEKSLFNNLLIANNKNAMQKYKGNYIVIFMSLQDLGMSDNYKEFCEHIKYFLSKLYSKYFSVKNGQVIYRKNKSEIEGIDVGYIKKILKRKNDINEIDDSLLKLCEMLKEIESKDVILLIDEFDLPIHFYHKKKYFGDITKKLSILFSEPLQKEAVFKAIFTGTLSVANKIDYSTFRWEAKQKVKQYDVTSTMYSPYYGFLLGEIRTVLKKILSQRINSKNEEYELCNRILKNYGGYRFGNFVIYNPWDIINIVSHFMYMSNESIDFKRHKFEHYWLGFVDDNLLKKLIKKMNENSKIDLKKLVKKSKRRKNVTRVVKLYFSISKCLEYRSDAARWGLLLLTGYVTCSRSLIHKNRHKKELIVPNEETRISLKKLL